MTGYMDMTAQERYDFCNRYNLARYPNIIMLAENDITNPIDLSRGDLDFYFEPLKELGEFNLIWRLKTIKERYNL